MSGWTLAASFWVFLLGLAAWLGALILSWQHWKRRGGRRGIGWLEGCRALIATCLLLTWLKPERISRVERVEKPAVVVLSDASGSMDTVDLARSNQWHSRRDRIAQLMEERFLQPLEEGARVEIREFAAPGGEGEIEGTDLAAALEEALQQHDHLKGVILLSDGDWNLGVSPLGAATRFRDRGVPVFPVAMGAETALPDLAILAADAPSYGLLGEQISIPVRLRNDFPEEVRATLRLMEGGTELEAREVAIPAGSELGDAVVWEPRETGERKLSLQLDPRSDESLRDNNRREFLIRIRTEVLKVLVADSRPRWEYRYLRNALERDPGVLLHCILFHPGLPMGSGRSYLSSFPSTREAIMEYDVVFLGDVGAAPGQLEEGDLDLIRGLVEQQAAGLVFLPGRLGNQASLLEGPLSDLYPVALDPGRSRGVSLQNESRLSLSREGSRHWLTRFDADAGRNQELWQQLPGFFWSAAVERSRPGSQVLAVHSSIRNSRGRMPLLVTRPAGAGKVLFMGTDSAWRWRRGVEDRYHYRFWSQVVRWMAHQRHLSQEDGIRMTWSPEAPEAGEKVYLQATVADPSGFPAEKGRVVADIAGPSGGTERIEFAMEPGGWGVFAAAWQPRASGDHRIALRSEANGRSMETTVSVEDPALEEVGRPVRMRVLREIASITGGQVSGGGDPAPAVAALRSLPEPEPLEARFRLWSDPWWGGFLLALLAAYWVGRKFAGLV